MPKIKDIKVQLEIDEGVLQEVDAKIEALGKRISALTLPLGLIGSALHRQVVNAETQQIIDGVYDEMVIALANFRPFEFKPMQPSDYPIDLRWEYQKTILSTPIRAVQWVWGRLTGNEDAE